MASFEQFFQLSPNAPRLAGEFVASSDEAYQIFIEAVNRCSMARFPLKIDIGHYFTKVPEWRPLVTVKMEVNDRHSGIVRDITVCLDVKVNWQMKHSMQLRRQYARAIYMAVRQCVLHEVAECFDYEGQLVDDPHDNPHPYLLRDEHDPKTGERIPDAETSF